MNSWIALAVCIALALTVRFGLLSDSSSFQSESINVFNDIVKSEIQIP